jgi:hypothetical protein
MLQYSRCINLFILILSLHIFRDEKVLLYELLMQLMELLLLMLLLLLIICLLRIISVHGPVLET